MSDEAFREFSASNNHLRFERNSKGQILVLPLRDGLTGSRNATIAAAVSEWNRKNNTGIAFDSSTGFRLPDTSVLIATVAWVQQERWDILTDEQRDHFVPFCPDFLVELMSNTDSLSASKAKMQQWLDNGCRLAWLICPKRQEVYIYKPGQPVQLTSTFQTILSGEDVLPGFSFDLSLLLK